MAESCGWKKVIASETILGVIEAQASFSRAWSARGCALGVFF
ncbi:hypothetical protein [Roseibium sp. MMSF_3412]|nr:hypothetical protein [Roseibium sp. MMSF_3412]